MIYDILFILLGLIIGGFAVNLYRNKQDRDNLDNAIQKAKSIIQKAEEEAEDNKINKITEAKKEIDEYRIQANNEINDRARKCNDTENRLDKREERLDLRSTSLDSREEKLNKKESILENRKELLDTKHSKIDKLIEQQETKLLEIAALTHEQAKKIVMDKAKQDVEMQVALYVRDEEQKAKDLAQKNAQVILANTLMQYSADATNDHTVSVVALPNDEMKGRIIGREGRNIRAIESLTGVDLIIDDTPEAVVISGFDPVRREVARNAIELLVKDGRIHPARIEEVVEKSRQKIDDEIREAGEDAIFQLGINKLHPDLIKYIGRLKYRTSYGQNVLKHSMEVAFFAGKLAAEIGADEMLARRAGILHDIGKAVDHEIEGSHVKIGVDMCKKYGESDIVLNAIECHHGDVEPTSIYGELVIAADKLSAARPGARRESIDTYLKRLEALENICNSFEGVESSYAIQAGREVRVSVIPEKVNDVKIYSVAKDIKERIEKELSYPGQIKVTVIRETRAVDLAK